MCPGPDDPGGAAPAAVPAPAVAAPTPPPGCYRIWPATVDGKLICEAGVGALPRRDEAPNPYHEKAAEIFFGMLPAPGMPPREQLELQSGLDKVLRIVQRIDRDAAGRWNSAFRIYYVRLFNAARLGLEGPMPAPALAQLEVAKIGADLLEDEGGNVKNAHLRTLGEYAALYSIAPLAVFALVSLFADLGLRTLLASLSIDTGWLKGFCMLWVGCFTGVWLSYGIRKTQITLTDLVIGDDDRMVPQIRLLFAAALATAFGLMFALQIVDVKLGEMSLSGITRLPSLAFLIGLLLGVAELAMPASLGSRADKLAAALR